jgi:hypothetical protein
MSTKYYQGYYELKNPEKYAGKNKPFFRSSWERHVMKLFDEHPNVTLWASESIRIPYINPFTGKQTTYVPDFLIIYIDQDGNKKAELIEVKPHSQILGNSKRKRDKHSATLNEEKWKMARLWCDQQGINFRVITENEIFRSPKKG